MSGTRSATGRGGRSPRVAGRRAGRSRHRPARRRRTATAHVAGRRGRRPRLRRRPGAQHDRRPDVGQVPHRRGGAAVLRGRRAGDPRVARRAGRRVGNDAAARRFVRGHGVLRDRRATGTGRESTPGADLQIVSASYFETLDVPVLQGRAFDARDIAGAVPVCIVNEAFVRRHVPDGFPDRPSRGHPRVGIAAGRGRSCARSWASRDRSRRHRPRPRTCSRSMYR